MLNSFDVHIVFLRIILCYKHRCCLLEQIYDLWGRTIDMNLIHCGDVLKIETANWKDICIDKRGRIIPIGKLKYMKDRRARQVHNEHIPIQIVDLKNHHIMDHPVQLLGKLLIIKLSFELNNYITPKEFIFTWGKLSKLYIWFSQWPLLLFKHSSLFLTRLFPSQ